MIESTNDHRGKTPSELDIARLCDMYYALPEPPDFEEKTSDIVFRMAYSQFDESHDFLPAVSRILLIYEQFWDFSGNDSIDIMEAIEHLTGLNLRELIVIASAYSSKAKIGFIYPYKADSKNKIDMIFSKEKQESFLNWVSCKYSEFRLATNPFRSSLPFPEYDKYRFNYLRTKPLIIPDINPSQNASKPFIAPSPQKLYEKITKSLFFDLADKFKGKDKVNPFRTSFGRAFEKYVGHIIKKTLPDSEVIPEPIYCRGTKRGPDWMMIEESSIVLIQVKLSGLFLSAKTLGDREIIAEDAKKNIIFGINQTRQFEADLHKYQELEYLSKRSRKIHRLILTYDKVYYANSFLRSIIEHELLKDNSALPNDYHWHIISIEEFELVLENLSGSLSNFLDVKEKDKECKEMDFRDYLAREISPISTINKYLDGVYKELFQEVEDMANILVP